MKKGEAAGRPGERLRWLDSSVSGPCLRRPDMDVPPVPKQGLRHRAGLFRGSFRERGRCRPGRLQVQRQPEAVFDLSHESSRNHSDLTVQEAIAQRRNLCHVGNRIGRKAGGFSREKDVPGLICEAQVRCQGYGKSRGHPAHVEAICLNDEDGAPKAGLGATRRAQISPPDLPSRDYQSLGPMEAACIRAITGSRSLGDSASTSFTLSVMSSRRRFARYSARASE